MQVLKNILYSIYSFVEMLGGTSIIPGLKHRSQGSMGEIPFSPLAIKRTNQEKQMEIVEYLKKLPPDKMVFINFVRKSNYLQFI